MLFVLDPSLDDAVRSPAHPDYDAACSELDRLARARWSRRLAIFIESRDFVGISAVNARLSSRAKSVFSHVHNARAFKGDLIKRLPIRVRLTTGNSDINIVNRGGVSEIIMPIGSVPHGFFDQPVLLAENLTDARCYLLFARASIASKSFGLPSVPVSAELRGGGGSATEAEYVQLKMSADRLVFCVLDSDIRGPSGTPSAWRGRISQHDVDNYSAIAASLVIEVYSIENLLGTGAILQTTWVKSDPAREHAVSADAMVWNLHESYGHWRYLALKKGIGCKDLRNGQGADPYWVGNANFFSTYSSKSCANQIHSCARSCLRIPKYADACAIEFVNHYESIDDASLSLVVSSVPSSVKPEFERVVKSLVGWCCVGGSVGVAGV